MSSATSTQTVKRAPGAGRISKTAAYYAAFITLGLSSASLGPTLPSLAAHTHTQLSQISYLSVARSLGYLLGSFGGGRLYDRAPGHPLMAVALLAMAAMLALAPVIPLLGVLAGVLFLLGMAEGTLDVGGNTLLVWVHGHKVGPFMNGLHFFFGVGAFLLPIVVAQSLLRTNDIIWAYWLVALLMLPVAASFLRLSSPQSEVHAADSPAGRVDYLLVGLIAAFFFLHVGAEGSYGTWIYTYAVKLGLSDKAAAAYLTSAFWGSFTLGRLLAIPIAARFSPRTMLFGDLIGCLVGLSAVLLWPGSLTMLWLGTSLMGLSIASVFPTSVSLAERCMPISGQITGWFFVGSSAGGMFLPWLIGQLFERIGPRVTMVAILADIVVAIAVLAALSVYARRSMAARGA